MSAERAGIKVVLYEYKPAADDKQTYSATKATASLDGDILTVDKIEIDIRRILFAVVKLGVPSKKATFVSTAGIFLHWVTASEEERSAFLCATGTNDGWEELAHAVVARVPPQYRSCVSTRDGACVLQRHADWENTNNTVYTHPFLVSPAGLTPCFCITAANHSDVMQVSSDVSLSKDAFSHVAWADVVAAVVLVAPSDFSIQIEAS